MRTYLSIALAFLLAACTPVEPPAVIPPLEIPSSESTRADEIFAISNPETRVTKKPFGILISPATSPVQPERFSGYHTGTDFEASPDEQDTDVDIFSICDGTVLFSGWVKGYGGVLIQDCTYENEATTVLYGHLDINSVLLKKGAELSKDVKIGHLGKGFSTETDDERKHLHLSIHRGTAIEYRGYVKAEEDLNQWIDPLENK